MSIQKVPRDDDTEQQNHTCIVMSTLKFTCLLHGGIFGLFTNFQDYEYIQTQLKQSEKPVSTENQSDTGEVNYTKK